MTTRPERKPRAQKPRPFCYWTEEMQTENAAWETDCDNLFEFTFDGPWENGFTFCPYCGLPLKVRAIASPLSESEPYRNKRGSRGL